MVLLCDVDHGLVHEHDLVMTRRAGLLMGNRDLERRLAAEAGGGLPEAA